MRPATADHYRALGLPRPSRKLFRLLRGPYSLRELASQLDIDPDTIRQWEQAVTRPSLPLLRQLVDHYLMFARKYNRDPLLLLPQNDRARARRAPAKEPAGTRPAPSLTPGSRYAAAPAAASTTPPPSSTEGEAKKML